MPIARSMDLPTWKPGLALCVLLTGLALPRTDTGAALVPVDLQQLVRHSPLIIRGEVLDMRSYRGQFLDRGDVILTDVRVRVDEVLLDRLQPATDDEVRGPGPSEAVERSSDVLRDRRGVVREVTVQVLGGSLDGHRQVCAESARFRKGERAILFLTPYNRRLWTTGWLQGKLRVLQSTLRLPREGGGSERRAVDTHVEGGAELPLEKTEMLPRFLTRLRKLIDRVETARKAPETAASDDSPPAESADDALQQGGEVER